MKGAFWLAKIVNQSKQTFFRQKLDQASSSFLQKLDQAANFCRKNVRRSLANADAERLIRNFKFQISRCFFICFDLSHAAPTRWQLQSYQIAFR